MSLHHEVIGSGTGYPLFVLHGILGKGMNWRTIAKKLSAARPDLDLVLVDLRAHGRSLDLDGEYSLAQCALDLCQLETHLGRNIKGALGHSFGGKVALEWMHKRNQDSDGPEQIWMLDSPPNARPDGRGSEEVLRVLSTLASIGTTFESRADFIDALRNKSISEGTARWLATNLKRGENGFTFGINLNHIDSLLDTYFARDGWEVIHQHMDVDIHLVAGDRSTVMNASQVDRAKAEAASLPNFAFHNVEDAGHWLHVDNPTALLRLLDEHL